MALDDNRSGAPSAVPGLPEAAAGAAATAERIDALLLEGDALNSARTRGLGRIRQMQADALAGRDVDMIEFSVLKAEVERAEARLDEVIAASEALVDEMAQVPGQVAALVRPVMERRERIAKASREKGYRA